MDENIDKEAELALRILKALPPEKQLLADEHYNRGNCYCAVGVLLPSTRTLPGNLQGSTIEAVMEYEKAVCEEAKALGFSTSFLSEIQIINDNVNFGIYEADNHESLRYKAVVSALGDMTAEPEEA